ncbi:hypothetical protein A5789_28215 [Nocardia sp. 852002-51101_SCH5132738]|nr:hypothetical protein A5789_28215 [Nocardia sp. 852002-51101_SCH5132738]OBB43209.1 hypothetical protein A5748_28915 [Nocardia sp. 852002-51244_SCH5132740]OBF83654.1 hypothetical protein A9X06_16190 [Mycobacterium sp. 852002-51759_SCH5129042]
MKDKRRARDQARRDAKRDYVLRSDPPPYEGYDEWYPVGEMRDADGYDTLSVEDREFAEMMIALGPGYRGLVPAAAVALEEMIRQGTIRMAINGMPGRYREMPVAELAGLTAQQGGSSDEREIAKVVHVMHTLGLIVVDDQEVVHLSLPPTHPETGGRWDIMGEYELRQGLLA